MPLSQFITSHVPHIIIAAICAFPAYKLSRWTLERLGEWVWDSTVGAIQADRQRLANCDANLQKMMTNCLPTMQKTLDKLVDEQQQSNILLSEQSGYLKGMAVALGAHTQEEKK